MNQARTSERVPGAGKETAFLSLPFRGGVTAEMTSGGLSGNESQIKRGRNQMPALNPTCQ